MTIDKAIRDLQARVDGEFNIKGVDKCEDLKLGIEAFKRLQAIRLRDPVEAITLLPGETQE